MLSPLKNKVSLFALVMLITGSIDSIRNLPVTALFGSSLVFFFIIGAIIFLLPTALVSAQLSVLSPQKGGIYHWVHKAFGPRAACFAVWLQWINTMVWFPTILSFIAGTIAYLINPSLVHNPYYLLPVVLIVFWLVTWLNMRGLQASAQFASFCAIIGLLIPFSLIIILGLIWILTSQQLHIQFNMSHWWAQLAHGSGWISLTGVITSFLGMELATVQAGSLERASYLFPRALSISAILILVIMIFGALTIAFVVPSSQISLVAGVMQTFSDFLRVYHIHWALPIIGLMILIGSLGGMVNWLISPARGLLHASEDGFLPQVFCKRNDSGVPINMLWLQGVVVTLICMSMFLMPAVNGFYWLLTDLSTELYLLMYVVMFVAAMRWALLQEFSTADFSLCKGRKTFRLVCVLGVLGCLLSLIVGFVPPGNIINIGSKAHFYRLFIGGMIIMVLPVLALWYYQAKHHHDSR